MQYGAVDRILTIFAETAKGDGRKDPARYTVDVFLIGGAGYNTAGPGTSTMINGQPLKLHEDSHLLELDVTQYGPGTDFSTCFIDLEGIAALRMRKV